MSHHYHLLLLSIVLGIVPTLSLLSQISPRAESGFLPLPADQDSNVPNPTSESFISNAFSTLPFGPYQNAPNSLSNVEFYVSNYGTVGLNVAQGKAGVMWPRGSGNQYIFAGGIWFGAKKMWPRDPDDPNSPPELQEKCIISYNPISGRSWFVPGYIDQPYEESLIDISVNGLNNYRLYNSLDYDPKTGEPKDIEDKLLNDANWPIWEDEVFPEPGTRHYFGSYQRDMNSRDHELFPGGPAIISDEDMFAVYKDTDLSVFEPGEDYAQRNGYPLGIQVEQQFFSWGTGKLRDVIILHYYFINMSDDTLYDCYAAPVYDIDIGFGGNDRVRTVIPVESQDSLDMGLAWTNPDKGDEEFGYLGVDILESPAVYPYGHPEQDYIRKDKDYYEHSEQVGLHAFRNWIIDIDPQTPQERYRFMAEETRDGDNGPGEKRLCISTGPFNMRPGDTAVVAVALLFAKSAGTEHRGTWEDIVHLIDLDVCTQQFYDTVLKTSGVREEVRRRMMKELDLW